MLHLFLSIFLFAGICFIDNQMQVFFVQSVRLKCFVFFFFIISDVVLLQSNKFLTFKERLRQRDLKVHEKTTYASKVNFKTAEMIKPTDSDEEEKEEETDKAVAVKDDPQFTIAVTRGNFTAFCVKMFRVEYTASDSML